MITPSPVEAFLVKYKTAKSVNSKDLRLTILEAEQLSIGISLLLAQESKLTTKIIELQDALLAEKQIVEVSGGSFD
jgi:hypothetical protein